MFDKRVRIHQQSPGRMPGTPIEMRDQAFALLELGLDTAGNLHRFRSEPIRIADITLLFAMGQPQHVRPIPSKNASNAHAHAGTRREVDVGSGTL